MTCSKALHMPMISARAIHELSYDSTNIIISPDSDESTGTPEEEENKIFPYGAGGFFHSVHVGRRSLEFNSKETPMTSVANQIKAIGKEKIEELEQTHILSSDEGDYSSPKESSSQFSDKEDDSFSTMIMNDDNHVIKIKRMHQLIFSPVEETLIGTEVIFRKQDIISDNYSPSLSDIHIPHLLSPGNSLHIDHQCVQTNRSLAHDDSSPYIMTSSMLVHPLDNEEFVLEQNKKCLPSQNMPLDLSLCTAEDDLELALAAPKITLAPTMALKLSSNINHDVHVVAMNETHSDIMPNNNCISSLSIQRLNTQTFSFPPSIWYLERKRKRRERFYVGVIISSIVVLLALGVIILIQQL